MNISFPIQCTEVSLLLTRAIRLEVFQLLSKSLIPYFVYKMEIKEQHDLTFVITLDSIQDCAKQFGLPFLLYCFTFPILFNALFVHLII